MMDPKPEKITFCSKMSPFWPSYSGEQWEDEEEETGLRYFSSSCSNLGNATKSWEHCKELQEVPAGWKVLLEDAELNPAELFPLPVFFPLWLLPWLEDFLPFTSDLPTSEVSLLPSWWLLEPFSAAMGTVGVGRLVGDSGLFLCFCLGLSLSLRLFFGLSWWDRCFSWVGDVDRLLLPAMKELPAECREVFILLKWYLQ